MGNSVYEQITREHPAYRDGYQVGQDVGLRIALDALTAERVHQERLARHPDSRSSACRVYADGVLLTVTRLVASRFRQ